MTTVDLMYHKMKVEQGLVHLGLLEFYHFILRLCEQAFPAEIGAHTSLCKLLDHQTRQEENT